MASVSSLDKDLAQLRRSKYTSEAAAVVKTWISSSLRENLPNGDLMDILKDGTVLCRLANNLGEKQIKFKKSAMPFVQMENISQFLNIVSEPPVSLPPHDRFLTVDLFEKKDPAQVLQCLGAFSRVAHNLKPSAFPETVGGLKSNAASPLTSTASSSWGQGTGKVNSPVVRNGGAPPVAGKNVSVTAWTKPEQEGVTAPAWNVAQYGYMGGASQGNQGITFGGRRQITNSPVGGMHNLTPAEKERRRKVEVEERERLREQSNMEKNTSRTHTRGELEDSPKKQPIEMEKEVSRQQKIEEEALRKQRNEATLRQRERELEEEAVKKEDALMQAAALRRQKEEELRRLKEVEMRNIKEEQEERQRQAEMMAEKRRWAEEEEQRRTWLLEKERQRESEREREATRAEEDRSRSQDAELMRERERVRQLERELEKARERERHYEAEKEARRREETERMRREAADVIRHRTGDRPAISHRTEERPITTTAYSSHLIGERPMTAHRTGDRSLDRESAELEEERRFLQGAWARETIATPPITEPTDSRPGSVSKQPRALPTPPRKLPLPPTKSVARKESWEKGDDKPLDSPIKEVNLGWSHMPFLEREREKERQRQFEWEQNQMETNRLSRGTLADDEAVWGESQYGYADDILDMY